MNTESDRGQEHLLSQANPEDNTRRRTSALSSIIEKKGANDRTFYRVQFADGTAVTIFDKKKLAGLTSGVNVEYELQRNERGYWNLSSIAKVDEKGENTPHPEYAELAPSEYAERSMNALTNATTIAAVMIQKDILQPKDAAQAMDFVRLFHSAMLTMHEQPKKNPAVQ